MRREGDGCPKAGNGAMAAIRWGEMGEVGTSAGWRVAPIPHPFGTAASHPTDRVWPLPLLRLQAP